VDFRKFVGILAVFELRVLRDIVMAERERGNRNSGVNGQVPVVLVLRARSSDLDRSGASLPAVAFGWTQAEVGLVVVLFHVDDVGLDLKAAGGQDESVLRLDPFEVADAGVRWLELVG
jgi:hypothetical protein